MDSIELCEPRSFSRKDGSCDSTLAIYRIYLSMGNIMTLRYPNAPVNLKTFLSLKN